MGLQILRKFKSAACIMKEKYFEVLPNSNFLPNYLYFIDSRKKMNLVRHLVSVHLHAANVVKFISETVHDTQKFILSNCL